ncbi:MAG: hypothetical protein ACI9BD_001008 [Candidatus Marinamargulisbacteria bacterium]|jgi:hypothetical protein
MFPIDSSQKVFYASRIWLFGENNKVIHHKTPQKMTFHLYRIRKIYGENIRRKEHQALRVNSANKSPFFDLRKQTAFLKYPRLFIDN